MSRIEPRTLKGFRDYLPEAQIPREWLIDTARSVYRSYGFLPIDTPALEYAEILAGKGGDESDKQMYRFKDHGERDVALRFDLTVPLARFVAQHANDLGLPFKRYHIASVWRGENTQRGRYREFMQCDFDTIGTESIAADVETALVIHDLMKAIGVEDFTIRINNRKLLTGVLEMSGVLGKTTEVLRVVDKLEKIGPQKVEEELIRTVGLSESQANDLNTFLTLGTRTANEHALTALARFVESSELARKGYGELVTVIDGLRATGVPADRFMIDVSIARGLDYYTGTIYETVLNDEKVRSMGSVCSGGRYDDLASLYTNQRLPGIGASLGLDRLLTALEELGKLPKSRATAPIFLPWFPETELGPYLAFAAALRRAGLGVELYPEPKKLKTQLQYADRRGFRYAIVIGGDEWTAGTCQLKVLGSGESHVVARNEPDGSLSRELVRRLSG